MKMESFVKRPIVAEDQLHSIEEFLIPITADYVLV